MKVYKIHKCRRFNGLYCIDEYTRYAISNGLYKHTNEAYGALANDVCLLTFDTK